MGQSSLSLYEVFIMSNRELLIFFKVNFNKWYFDIYKDSHSIKYISFHLQSF